MKKLILVFLFSISLHAQSLIIQGYVDDLSDSTSVWFNKSVDDNYKNYLNSCEKTLLVNGFFEKKINIKGAGFMTIESNKFMPSILLYAEDNNPIKINIKKDGTYYIIGFEGRNSKGLEELNRSKLMNFKKLASELRVLFQNSKSENEFLLGLHKLRLELSKPFLALLEEKQITDLFFENMNKEVDLNLLFVVNVMAYDYLDNPNKFKLISLNMEDINKILYVLDEKYDAFDEKYDNCDGLRRIIAIQRKCQNISKGILAGQKNNFNIWYEDYEDYSFAPKNLQELLAVNNIKNLGLDKSGCSYAQFKKTFYNSVYNPFLDNLVNELSIEEKTNPFTFATFQINQTREKLFKIISTEEFKTISELISNKFKNKAVFIDLWATYCAPCKAEFSYADKLYSFLNTQNIEMLYISVDNQKQETKCKKDVLNYQLIGYHYFASNSIQKDIKKILHEENDIAIPRYLLFNEKGELVLNNAKKPSMEEELYHQIIGALK
jgi:thiol-disulfide isomerase/thioredoxin